MLSPAAPALSAARLSQTVALKAEPYSVDGEPFAGAEEAWFWAVQAQDAKAAGARIVAGCGQIARPCEPQDVLRAVDRLYRMRKLMRDHLHVLVHYGRRQSAPVPERFREQRAHSLWREAFEVIAPALRDKGIAR
ncbi:hypothetical protein [Azospirillum sp. B506]|uniref:hypothetical protein n=1 Tax=Azospirillum sp. B506 TaxID=137721 RepID=UPI0003481F81|nr:hypothetical protein [Azospirillum sp. B506]